MDYFKSLLQVHKFEVVKPFADFAIVTGRQLAKTDSYFESVAGIKSTFG